MTEPQNTDLDPADTGGAATGDAESSIASLGEQLRAALAEKEDNFRGWQRAQADYANFRRRSEQEREEFVKTSEATLLLHLLPVVDDFERALGGLPPELRGLTWAEGVALIHHKLQAILELHGLVPIEALGKRFDPYEHEAVMRDGDPDEATTVTAELQRGYRLQDRVLRPTYVRVGPQSTVGTQSITEDR